MTFAQWALIFACAIVGGMVSGAFYRCVVDLFKRRPAVVAGPSYKRPPGAAVQERAEPSVEDWVTVRLFFDPEAYEKVWTAAAFSGLSRTQVINFGVVLLEAAMSAMPGTRLTWRDPSGDEHVIVVRK